jgi:hypothetical protein
VRTTLTLDEDVAAKLRAEARRTGLPFKQMVNSLLRLGLSTRARTRALAPFKVKAKPLGLQPGLSYDNIEDLLERTEGVFHR